MNTLQRWIPVLGLLLAGCETVTSPTPVGEAPAALEAEEWAGTWFNQDGKVEVEVVDAATGRLRAKYVENGKAQTADLLLLTSGDWTFVNVTEEDFDDEPNTNSYPETRFLWARVVREGGRIVAWGPDAAVFVELVTNSDLPGAVDEGSVVLGPLTKEHYRRMTAGDLGVVLDWEHPFFLLRQAPPETH